MAGSYKHIIDKDGSYIGVESIDHLGDADEALEECYYMIQHLSGGDKTKIFEAWRDGYYKKSFGRLPTCTLEEFWDNE